MRGARGDELIIKRNVRAFASSALWSSGNDNGKQT